MPLPEQELIAAVEAVVFVSSEPVTLARLQEVFADETAESLGAALEGLTRVFEQDFTG